MSNTVTAQQAAAAEKPATAKLIMPRPDAIKFLKTAVDTGAEIKAMRIRNGDELDKARSAKLQWTQDCTDLLAQLFDNTSVADYYNDWVGKIFPEYAEFGNFVDQFYEEMDHRLGKLRTVLKRLEQAGDGTSSSPAAEEPAKQESEAQPRSQAKQAASSPAQQQQRESHMPAAAAADKASSNKVLFVSHGPKDPSSEAVLQFMQQLSLGVTEADHTNGLIETLDGRNDMGFIIVMNAVDNMENGKASLSENSMFKLGYCAGKLGIKRMCMMHGPTHPAVGDGQGIAHLPVDPNGGWQLHLARQMKRAGLDVDLNRLA
jgi:hypothetical protein